MVFASLVCELEVLGLINHIGVEIIADLEIWDSSLSCGDKSDFVFDCRLLENCFHLGYAFVNAVTLLKC